MYNYLKAISVALADGKLKNTSLLEGGLADDYDLWNFNVKLRPTKVRI